MNQITGSPSAYKVGRRVLLVSYVSMGEWQTFRDLLKVDAGRAVLELMYCSLHRADPFFTRRTVRRLMNKKTAAGLMRLICELSIPPSIKGLNAVIFDKEAERTMKTAYRRLSIIHGWTPAEISDMSPIQVYSYQLGGKDGSGIEKMSSGEYKSFRARRGGLN